MFRPVIVSSVLFLAACGTQAGPASAMPPAPTPVVTVEVAPVVDAIERTGRIEASAQVDLRPRVGGVVERVLVEDGAAVAAGQVLVELDPRPFQASRDRAAAQVAQVDAALEQTRRELARSERIRASDPRAVGEEDLERRRQAVAFAEAQRAAASAALVQADLDLGWTRVTAPFTGRTSRLLVDPGALVQAGTSVLTTLMALDPLEVAVGLDDREAARLAELARGASVALTVEPVMEGPARPAVVTFIDARTDGQGASVQVRATLAADPGLRPGTAVRVRIPQSTTRSVPVIPETAVMARQTARSVLVVGPEDKLQVRPVVLGRRLPGDRREVVSGLAPGERIVVHPAFPRVMPGMPIRPVTATGAEPAR